MTMAMSDARISMFAAPMAEMTGDMLGSELPSRGGLLRIGVVMSDGVSMIWQTHDIAPLQRVTVDDSPSWSVHISSHAHRVIEEEVARWPQVETGGILIGRFSDAAQTFYVVDVVPAPNDSVRSAGRFVLGVQGVAAELRRYGESCNNALYCLGTWHSHLSDPDPSDLDRSTAATLAQTRIVPSVLLIHTPAGYRAILADGSAIATTKAV